MVAKSVNGQIRLPPPTNQNTQPHLIELVKHISQEHNVDKLAWD